MRIVMLVHNTIARGTFNRAHSLGRHLVRRGHQVALHAGASRSATPQRRILDGVEVIESFDPLPARARESGLSPFDLLGRIRHVLSVPCDLVHCFDHRPTVSLPGLFLARRRRVPCIFDWADLWGFGGIASERKFLPRVSLGRMDHFFEDRVRRGVDGHTVINTALLERARERFSAPIHLLPVGANSDLIKPLSKAEMRCQFGLPQDAAIALHAGLAPYDSEFLARSFVELARMHPGALFVMAGRRMPKLEKIIAAAGRWHQLIHLGLLDRSTLAKAMACADVLLLPYTNRSVNRHRYPNKFGDYLAAGRAIVTNSTGDLGRLVAKEKVGVIAPETPEGFATAIQQLFQNPAQAEELGRRARLFAETTLDWGVLAAGLERFYQERLGLVPPNKPVEEIAEPKSRRSD